MSAIVNKRSLVGHGRAATKTSSWLLIVSDYDEDVELAIDGRTIPLTMTVMGADAAAHFPGDLGVQQAGYYCQYNIHRLKQLTQYRYTLTQRGTPRGLVTFTGHLMTAPGVGDNYALALFSCSGHGTQNHGGGWNSVKRYAEGEPGINPDNMPLAAVVGMDDMAYLDTHAVDDTAHDIPHQTSSGSPNVLAETEYRKCIAWMAWAGMMENVAEAAVLNGREVSHTWCNDNINRMGLWGDHEIFNDVGYGTDSATYRTDGAGVAASQTVDLFKACEAAYDIFWTGGGGDHFNLDGDESDPPNTGRSRGWSWEYGPLQILAIDRNYGDMDDRDGNGAFLASQAQIDGAVKALNESDARFRIVLCAHTYRYTGAGSKFDAASDDNLVLDLFSNTSDSLMAKHAADGSKFFMYQGDNHEIRVHEHGRATAGRLPEQFYSFNVAGMRIPRGSMNLSNTEDPEKGWYDFSSSPPDYLPPAGAGALPEFRGIYGNGLDATTPKISNDFDLAEEGVFLLVEVYGKETPMRTVASIVWGGSNKRQQVYEYIDDSGDNLPARRNKMAIR